MEFYEYEHKQEHIIKTVVAFIKVDSNISPIEFVPHIQIVNSDIDSAVASNNINGVNLFTNTYIDEIKIAYDILKLFD